MKKIKTVGDLRKILNDLDDNYKLDIRIMKEISEKELIGSHYPYPWEMVDGYLEFQDIGVSDKELCIGVYENKSGENIMKEYAISTATLFTALARKQEDEYAFLEYGGYIQKGTDGCNEYFDLKTNIGTPCMDGEICKLIEETEDYVVLQEETEQIPFKLSRKEFEIAATVCPTYIL